MRLQKRLLAPGQTRRAWNGAVDDDSPGPAMRRYARQRSRARPNSRGSIVPPFQERPRTRERGAPSRKNSFHSQGTRGHTSFRPPEVRPIRLESHLVSRFCRLDATCQEPHVLCQARPLTAHQPITHDQACTGLNSGASWEQIGNSIGNVSPMRPQCENTKVATCEPWIRRL